MMLHSERERGVLDGGPSSGCSQYLTGQIAVTYDTSINSPLGTNRDCID